MSPANKALRVFQSSIHLLCRYVPVKRSAAQYAVLTRLLDDVVDLDESARAAWLSALPSVYEGERPALSRMLSVDRAAANRRLKSLESRLRSSARGVRALCERMTGAD